MLRCSIAMLVMLTVVFLYQSFYPAIAKESVVEEYVVLDRGNTVEYFGEQKEPYLRFAVRLNTQPSRIAQFLIAPRSLGLIVERSTGSGMVLRSSKRSDDVVGEMVWIDQATLVFDSEEDRAVWAAWLEGIHRRFTISTPSRGERIEHKNDGVYVVFAVEAPSPWRGKGIPLVVSDINCLATHIELVCDETAKNASLTVEWPTVGNVNYLLGYLEVRVERVVIVVDGAGFEKWKGKVAEWQACNQPHRILPPSLSD